MRHELSNSALVAAATRLLPAERARFQASHPRCLAAGKRCAEHFLYGVPLHWMKDWATPTPLVVDQAQGAHFSCTDGVQFADFCLGDSGALFGHSPPAVARAIAEQAKHGLTTMLPASQTAKVGELLAQRFGLPCWQLATSASDANRFVLRWARAVTGRRHILVFDGCYHGAVDDALVDLTASGATTMRASLLGQAQDLTATTRVVPFNDLAALGQALADRQVACVLSEPALTNCGMVLPQPGFLAALRDLTRRYDTLLVFDETHTLSTSLCGAGQTWGITPDLLVIGKAIAGGLPAAVYGFSANLAEQMQHIKDVAPPGHSGIGTTLAGNPLTLAALRANLAEVMTPDAYAAMLAHSALLAERLSALIGRHNLPWSISQLGARLELQFCPLPPTNGAEARAAFLPELEDYLHLYLINRGVMLTPFHNMMLTSPATTASSIDLLAGLLAQALGELIAA